MFAETRNAGEQAVEPAHEPIDIGEDPEPVDDAPMDISAGEDADQEVMPPVSSSPVADDVAHDEADDVARDKAGDVARDKAGTEEHVPLPSPPSVMADVPAPSVGEDEAQQPAPPVVPQDSVEKCKFLMAHSHDDPCNHVFL